MCPRTRCRVLVFTLAVVLPAGGASGFPAASAVIGAVPRGTGTDLAWIRFDEAPESYMDHRYYFLGYNDLGLTIDVPSRPGLELGLLWGAKGDERTAILTVAGRSVKLSQGGYRGFRWLKVPLPESTDGVGYRIRLARDFGRPAFLAALRVTERSRSETPFDPSGPCAHMVLTRMPASFSEAFPEMRPIWDGKPTRSPDSPTDPDERLFLAAERHGREANESLYRCRRYVSGWLAHADPESGLIPRNLGRDRLIWNAKDSAADNYPFMVLTCRLTDRSLFDGRMREMLRTEQRLTSRLGVLPDTWSFATQGFFYDEPDLDRIIFGASEYVKDGLLPLTEWLGETPWSERMIALASAILSHAEVTTPWGRIPSLSPEVNGEMLQSLSRLYWMTGQTRFLEGALAIADYYLLGTHHPTRDFKRLRLWDHGCEVIAGLSEVYVAVHFARPEKQEAYRRPIHEMLDRILDTARNPHGLLYGSIDPRTGEHEDRLCDTWGYNYNAFYTVGLIDDLPRYREAIREVLDNLQPYYLDYEWGSADEFADSIEGALNLVNRVPSASAAAWIDSEIHDLWRGQRPDGVIEGWHGDGNVARTGLMFALWKTQGLTIEPWRADVRLGVARRRDLLYVSLVAGEADWTGRLRFDIPRHSVQMHLPLDYPRINQFPEWATVDLSRRYRLREAGGANALGAGLAERAEAGEIAGGGRESGRGRSYLLAGSALRAGLKLTLAAGREVRLVVDLAGD